MKVQAVGLRKEVEDLWGGEEFLCHEDIWIWEAVRGGAGVEEEEEGLGRVEDDVLAL